MFSSSQINDFLYCLNTIYFRFLVLFCFYLLLVLEWEFDFKHISADAKLRLISFKKGFLFCTEWSNLSETSHKVHGPFIAPLPQAGCMYVHGGVVNMSGNRRTASLYKVWLVVPSLLELTWEKLLKTFPHLTQLSTLQLLSLGLTHALIQRLK